MTRREILTAVARVAAARLRRDPRVAGLVLYGSLAGDPTELTPFSDVDIAVIPRGKPPGHFAEHRLIRGAKADFTMYPRATLRRLSSLDVEGLAKANWIDDLLARSLLIGGAETILYDPLGLLRDAKRRMKARTTWREVTMTRARLRAAQLARHMAKALAALRRGDARAGGRHGEWVLRTAMHHLLEAADTKRLRVACARAGTPGLEGRIEARLNGLTAGTHRVAVCRTALREVWRHLWRTVWRPASAAVRKTGVREPSAFELRGAHPVFWPGPRIHELGRVKAELDLTFRWSGLELRRGRPWKAAEQLTWFCRWRRQRERALGLAEALAERGVDLRRYVRSALHDSRFHRLCRMAQRAEAGLWRAGSSRRRAAAIVATARESMRALDRLTAPALARPTVGAR